MTNLELTPENMARIAAEPEKYGKLLDKMNEGLNRVFEAVADRKNVFIDGVAVVVVMIPEDENDHSIVSVNALVTRECPESQDNPEHALQHSIDFCEDVVRSVIGTGREQVALLRESQAMGVGPKTPQ